MRRRTLLALLLMCSTSTCSLNTISSRSDTRAIRTDVLETSTRYQVDAVALADGEIQIALGRTCEEVTEITREDVTIETLRYDTSTAWWTALGLAGVALIATSVAWGSVDDGCEFFGDYDPQTEPLGCTATDKDRIDEEENRAAIVTGVSIASTLAFAAGVLYFDVVEEEKETVTGQNTERLVDTVPCQAPWQTGDATLTASSVGTRFSGASKGDGTVSIDVANAPTSFWKDANPLQLQIPANEGWIAVTLPESVRTAGLNLSVDEVGTRRAYIHYDGEAAYHDLLKAGTTRVQSVLSRDRHFQFVSDADTRERIENVVNSVQGDPLERRQRLLEAARQENIKRVFVVTVNPLFEKQVVFVLTAHDATSGDQLFTQDAPADLNDAFEALQQFDHLGQSYLEWETD